MDYRTNLRVLARKRVISLTIQPRGGIVSRMASFVNLATRESLPFDVRVQVVSSNKAHIASEREASKLFAPLQARGRAEGGGAADVKFEIATSEFTLEDCTLKSVVVDRSMLIDFKRQS